MNGFLIIDKPEGPTSFDIIRIARKVTGIKKIGHNGTLDPLATGLLLLAMGNATRLLPYLPSEPKKYSFTIKFGATTKTLDRAEKPMITGKRIPTKNELLSVLSSFIGTITQTPPKFSAIKINGKRAYKLARKDCEFSIPSREITIEELSLIHYYTKCGIALLTVQCSGGTYVRTLVADIAQKLGTVGYAFSIRRTISGESTLAQGITMSTFKTQKQKAIIPTNIFLSKLPSYIASSEELMKISHGNPISPVTILTSPRIFIYTKKQEIAAVAEKGDDNLYHPRKVFIQ